MKTQNLGLSMSYADKLTSVTGREPVETTLLGDRRSWAQASESVTEIPAIVQVFQPAILRLLKKGQIENVSALWAVWSPSQLLNSATVAQTQL